VALSWDAAWMRCPTSKILRPPVGQDIGGHAVGMFVYDDSYGVAGEVECLANSWSLNWGPNGTAYLKDEYFNRWVEAYRVTGIQ
jgi:C1A family cysteine protease